MNRGNGISIQMMNRQRFFAMCGIVAPIFFALLVIIASLLRSDYSQTSNFVSDLGVGPYAIIQNINFIIFGLLTISLALGLRSGLPSPQGRALKAGVWFVVLFGLGVLFAGVFPEDYLSQMPHNLVSATAFVAIIIAQLLIWQGLRNEDSMVWGRYRTYSLISGLLSIIFVILLKISMTYYVDYQGVAQRLFLAVPWIWIGITGLKLYYIMKKE
ncbi:DUF998 domain-containing protein [uncultured Methanobacterium sp.]|uniref:DUF998 domain-containing protein n=1 Tax=uncultured Methanobacterium sp. TaxID=176306 RepID=UPI002AA8D2E5|nr:DUF998 domain-containing protein [uncultured Methanobacterium sp.]